MGDTNPTTPNVADGVVKREITDEEMNEQYILNQRILYLESKCEKLDDANRYLRKQLAGAKEEQKDVVEHLNKNLENHTKAFREIESENEERKATIEALKQEMADKLAEERKTHNTELVRLEAKLDQAQRELNELDAFKRVKGQMEKELASMKGTLDRKDEEMRIRVRDMERSVELERARLAKELELKIQEVKDSLERDTDDKLDQITKKTAMANEQMTWELSFQSKETKKIVVENDDLRDEVKALKQELNLAKEREAQLAKKSHAHQKTVDKLLETLKTLEEQLEDTRSNLSRTRASLVVANRENESLAIAKDALEKNLNALQRDHHELRSYATSVAEKAEIAEKEAEERSRVFLQEIIQAEQEKREKEEGRDTHRSRADTTRRRTVARREGGGSRANKPVIPASYLDPTRAKEDESGEKVEEESDSSPPLSRSSKRSPPRSRGSARASTANAEPLSSRGEKREVKILVSGQRPSASRGSLRPVPDEGSETKAEEKGEEKKSPAARAEGEGSSDEKVVMKEIGEGQGQHSSGGEEAEGRVHRRRDVVRGRTVGRAKGKPPGRTVGTEGGAAVQRSAYLVHPPRPRLRELSGTSGLSAEGTSSEASLSLDDSAVHKISSHLPSKEKAGKDLVSARLEERRKKEREEEKGKKAKGMPGMVFLSGENHNEDFEFGTLAGGTIGTVVETSSARTLPSPNSRLVTV